MNRPRCSYAGLTMLALACVAGCATEPQPVTDRPSPTSAEESPSIASPADALSGGSAGPGRGLDDFIARAQGNVVDDLDAAIKSMAEGANTGPNTGPNAAHSGSDPSSASGAGTAAPAVTITQSSSASTVDRVHASPSARGGKTTMDALVGGPVNFASIPESQGQLAWRPLTTEEELRDLIEQTELLVGDEADTTGLPFGPALRLGALETLVPGAIERRFGPLDRDSDFTPEERVMLEAWRTLHRDIGRTAGDSAGGDPAEMARALREAAERTEGLLPLRIQEALLCREVYGYASYEPFYQRSGRVVLASGTPQRAIVYAELDRFVSEAVTKGGVSGYEVDLRQKVELIHLDRGASGQDLVAWEHPEERITDFCRRPRRDFFTLQIIDLPANLSIGKYNLRVTVRESTTGAVAQRVIPIDVLAAPTATGDPGSDLPQTPRDSGARSR